VDFGAIDGDSNSLPDDWERFYFGNAGNDAAADPDGDGVSTGQELLNGTDPTVADTRHPADLNPINNALTIHEITAYAAAWKLGQAWSVAPTNIDLNFVTRAGYLWKNGEEYRLDLTVATNAPLWWVPGRQTRALAPRALRPVEGMGELTRTLPRNFTPGQPVTVTLETAPSPQVSCHAIEEQIPAGWNVTAISAGGVLDATNRVIRWGLFFDAETRSLSYTLTPAPSADLAEFHGDGSFDGRRGVTAGRSLLTRSGYAKLVILPGDNPAAGGPIGLQGEPAGDYVMEVSDDLIHWQVLARQTADETGRTEFSETGTGAQRFYRARVLVK
jgi:hypothetical protein